ncbi:MAG: hypothetical protein LBU39_05465 [Desulfobulbaceae bacterium]|nr:hypothetical protein [Desulfobulbaceae bacterium]
MRLFSLLLALFVSSQLLACASSPDTACLTCADYHKVYDRFPRMSPMGFEVKPPAGKAWFEALIDNELVYRKKVGKTDYAILSKASQLVFSSSEVSFASLQKVIRQRQSEFLNNRRYKNQSLDIREAEDREGCARYSLRYDDYGNERVSSRSVVHVVNRGLVCSHPDMPQNGIELSYQEQRLNNAKSVSFSKEGEAFLNSLVARPLYADASSRRASRR